MTTRQEATEARKVAEAAFKASPTDENLKTLQAAGKLEMDLVLARFDARQAAEAEEITESPAEEITTKVATEIRDNGRDMIMTEFGWVTVTRVLVDYSRRTGQVFSIRFNGRYSFKPTDQVQVHPDPESYRHERFQASRRAMRELTVEAAKIR